MTYAQKLKDPRWFIKRATILKRDNNRCCYCHKKPDKPEVHHCFYQKNKEPWDYPNYMLKTLCRECHQSEFDNYGTWVEFMENCQTSNMPSDWFCKLGAIAQLNPNELKSFIKKHYKKMPYE